MATIGSQLTKVISERELKNVAFWYEVEITSEKKQRKTIGISASHINNMNGQRLEYVEEFEYVGSAHTQDGTCWSLEDELKVNQAGSGERRKSTKIYHEVS